MLETAETSGRKGKIHSFRNEGLVVFLTLEFKDDWHRNIAYTYSVHRATGLDWTVTRPNFHEPGGSINQDIEWRAGAMRIRVHITGTIGEFDFQEFLIQVTSALALLGLAGWFINSVLIYILPKSHLYDRAMYLATVPLSNIPRDTDQDRVSIFEAREENSEELDNWQRM